MHHSLQSATRTLLPAGMVARISASVPGALRKLTLAMTTADRAVWSGAAGAGAPGAAGGGPGDEAPGCGVPGPLAGGVCPAGGASCCAKAGTAIAAAATPSNAAPSILELIRMAIFLADKRDPQG